jgi:selenocysteine-specific elongation factor
MIVATAGHVDHGKTSLIRALTGVDTDRLPEEKARGISIEPGFAYWALDGGGAVGFVDVPGHERFVRNMLAGVCGIDFVILVVAADDGVMPQTIEHLQIMQLLGIANGVAVVTKVDCVRPDRVEEVIRETRSLLAGTPLASVPLLAVSALTGEGMAELEQLIRAAADTHSTRRQEGQHFRMAIDRAFTVAGIGTVVTGTVFNGTVAPGQHVMLSPGGSEVRVRGIQIHGVAVDHAAAGSRCAINLAGIEVDRVVRGDWLLDPAIHAPTDRIDVQLTLLAGSNPMSRPTFVHLHLGTGDVIARVAPRDGASLEPGKAATVQLRSERPVAALNGDRFIIRDQAARRTLGGGIVLDPFPAVGRRANATRPAVTAALASIEPRAALAKLLAIPDYAIDLEWFERTFDVVPDRAAALYRELDAAVLGRERPVAVAVTIAAALRQAVLARLDDFHRAQPQASGVGVATLRKELATYLPVEAFQFLLRELADARQVEISRSEVRRAGHDFSLSPAEQVLWQRILPMLAERGASPPAIDELASDLRTTPRVVLDLMHRLRKAGQVWQMTESRFYAANTLATLAATAAAVASASAAGEFTAAQFRDAIGTGRTLAIQILELFDRIGVTLRLGDSRRMQTGFAAIVGAGIPLQPLPPARTATATPASAQVRGRTAKPGSPVARPRKAP